MIWPVGERFEKVETEDTTALLFPPSRDIDPTDRGFLRFLMLPGPPDNPDARLQFADAVAVAGVDAVTGAQRRAVVLILSRKKDDSVHKPRAVRNYLAALGVPLFVWSPTGPRPEAASTWGEVVDISSVPRLNGAVNRLRDTLKEQRIAWVDVDPLTALRLKASERCGIDTMARP